MAWKKRPQDLHGSVKAQMGGVNQPKKGLQKDRFTEKEIQRKKDSRKKMVSHETVSPKRDCLRKGFDRK